MENFGSEQQRRVMRVSPEYADGPLWDATPELGNHTYVVIPSDLGLSPDLTVRMMSWNQFWADNFGAFTGWVSQDAEEIWRLEGLKVVAQLTEEIGHFADVKYEPWPLDD